MQSDSKRAAALFVWLVITCTEPHLKRSSHACLLRRANRRMLLRSARILPVQRSPQLLHTGPSPAGPRRRDACSLSPVPRPEILSNSRSSTADTLPAQWHGARARHQRVPPKRVKERGCPHLIIGIIEALAGDRELGVLSERLRSWTPEPFVWVTRYRVWGNRTT